MPDPIRFYRARDAHGYLSNFYRAPFVLGGVRWLTVEHYFQALKSRDPEAQAYVRAARSPLAAKRRGRRVELREDWDGVRVPVMRHALRAKFTQRRPLARLLVDTGGAPLIEAAPRDYFWGEGADGSGHNMLGRLLAEVREELRRGRQAV